MIPGIDFWSWTSGAAPVVTPIPTGRRMAAIWRHEGLLTFLIALLGR